jgi:hypothetical protein
MSVYKITGGDLCYIGSTNKTIEQRFNQHKHNYKYWLSGKYKSNCSSFRLFQAVGIENCKVELIEQSETLKERERFHVQNTVCVNIRVPNRTLKEHYRDTRDRQLDWKRATFDCICGNKYTQCNKARHFNSKKHLTLCQKPPTQNTHQSSCEMSCPPDSQDQ